MLSKSSSHIFDLFPAISLGQQQNYSLLNQRPFFLRLGFLFISLLIASNLVGQQDSVTTLAFGVGGGWYSNEINLRNTSGNTNQVSAVNGLQFGASLRYFNNKAVGFIGELNISNGGWRESTNPDTLNYSRKFTYIELQMLTQVAIGRKLIRPILQAGPYLSIPIAQSDELPNNVIAPDSYYGNDLPFRINYGISVGTGLYIALGSVGIQLEGRAILGVSDLIKSGSFGVSQSRRQSFGGRVTFFYELP